MSLDTLTNVKARLGISDASDDSLLALLQESADKFIENWCDRAFEGGTFTEYHSGGPAFIHLRNYPIASVASVKVDPSYAFGSDTILPSSAYVVHAEWGVIQSLIGAPLPAPRRGLVGSDLSFWPRGPRAVQVVYSVTTNQVPGEVKEAYARLVGHWYRRVKTESASSFLNVTQQKFGDTLVNYGQGGNGALPEDVRELLASYRAPRL